MCLSIKWLPMNFELFSEEAVQDPIQFNDFIERRKNDLKKH